MRENEFIEWVCRQSAADPSVVPLGPGDDTAIVVCEGQRLLLTVDQVLDGVHFHLKEAGPRAVGDKALARSVSDIAAMAGLPLAAVVSAALPPGMTQDTARQIQCGLQDAAARCGCPVVGGDLGAWRGPLALSVTVVGRPGGIEPVRRSGAHPGDALCVTGTLGGAWRTRRHLSINPRIAEARVLASGYGLHAMIDLSDGLSSDLSRLCRASGVGAEVHAADIPIHDDAHLDRDDPTGLRAALNDGEDYELLFTLPAEQADRLLADQPLAVPVRRIGMVRPGGRVELIHTDGRRQELSPGGWEHITEG